MQREKRVRRCPNRFTPTEVNIRPTHYLLYFDDTASYNIASSSSIYKVSGTTATLNLRGKKLTATIVMSGKFHFTSALLCLIIITQVLCKCVKMNNESVQEHHKRNLQMILVSLLLFFLSCIEFVVCRWRKWI